MTIPQFYIAWLCCERRGETIFERDKTRGVRDMSIIPCDEVKQEQERKISIKGLHSERGWMEMLNSFRLKYSMFKLLLFLKV